jgi:hypothetical protein
MRGIRQHPLTQPVAVLVAVLLACALVVVALGTIPHQARLERWLENPHSGRVTFEDQYLFAVIVVSTDPTATTAHLAPVLAQLTTVRVVRPGERVLP